MAKTEKESRQDNGILRSITLNTRRITAPIRIASVEVSPIVPAVFPRNRFKTFTLSPAFMAASGVAPDTASYVKSVIFPAKEIRRKHLAARAGFIKFCPSPPKSCFTNRMAKTEPSTGRYHGADAGRFSASRSPVTSALRSSTVTFLCISFS